MLADDEYVGLAVADERDGFARNRRHLHPVHKIADIDGFTVDDRPRKNRIIGDALEPGRFGRIRFDGSRTDHFGWWR